MIDPWIELGGWIIAQAIDDICHPKNVEQEDLESAWKFLQEDPCVEQILEYIDYGRATDDKRKYILTVVIPQKMNSQIGKIVNECSSEQSSPIDQSVSHLPNHTT